MMSDVCALLKGALPRLPFSTPLPQGILPSHQGPNIVLQQSAVHAELDTLLVLHACRKMPGGGLDKVFVLDMAHMDLGSIAISPACSPPGSPRAATAASAAAAAAGAADAGADISISIARLKAGSAAGIVGGDSATPVFAGLAAGDGGIEDDRLEGTQRSTASCASSLARAASAGDRSTHLTTVAGAPEVLSTHRLKRTLNLTEGKNGMLVGQYVLQPADAPTSPSPSSAHAHGGALGTGSGTSWLASIGIGAAAQQARSVHAGNKFFNAATAGGGPAGDRSTSRSGRVAAVAAAAALAANKTVHGGTAHAATKQSARVGIFYEG
ncbi:hypothetical protein COO60DRAFT_660797 [Scenedesmus sp. NREL 46B-D3]|nr:hypothetical protein COO60DRAFT_660797 [Scenedesmus sp. NREL 46B-D3]